MNLNKAITEHRNLLPKAVLNVIMGISDPTRLGIMLALLKNGTMTFNEMKTALEINQSTLSKQLIILQNCNMVKNFFEKKKNRIRSYYEVTEIPEQLLDLLFAITHESNTKLEKPSREIIQHQKNKMQELDNILNDLSSWKDNFDNEIERKPRITSESKR